MEDDEREACIQCKLNATVQRREQELSATFVLNVSRPTSVTEHRGRYL